MPTLKLINNFQELLLLNFCKSLYEITCAKNVKIMIAKKILIKCNKPSFGLNVKIFESFGHKLLNLKPSLKKRIYGHYFIDKKYYFNTNKCFY